MGIDGAEIKRAKGDHQPSSEQQEHEDEQRPQPKPRSKLLIFIIVIFSICLGYFAREYLPYLKKQAAANDETDSPTDSSYQTVKNSDDVPQNFIYTSIYSGKTREEIEYSCRMSWSGPDVEKCVEENVRMRKNELNNEEMAIRSDVERRERELKDQLTEMTDEYERLCRKENPRGSKEFYKCMEEVDRQRAELSSNN